jgi:hypothetical protein
MNSIFKVFFGDKTVQDILEEDARAIKQRGEDTRVYTYDERNDQGFIRARAIPVPKGEEREIA